MTCWRSAALSLVLLAGPAVAAEPLYRAGLEKPAGSRLIIKELAWSCDGAVCTAARTAASPDINVCASVARKLGRLVSFQAGDRAFEAGELEKCNKAAN
jgi:hypothetical protein